MTDSATPSDNETPKRKTPAKKPKAAKVAPEAAVVETTAPETKPEKGVKAVKAKGKAAAKVSAKAVEPAQELLFSSDRDDGDAGEPAPKPHTPKRETEAAMKNQDAAPGSQAVRADDQGRGRR